MVFHCSLVLAFDHQIQSINPSIHTFEEATRPKRVYTLGNTPPRLKQSIMRVLIYLSLEFDDAKNAEGIERDLLAYSTSSVLRQLGLI